MATALDQAILRSAAYDALAAAFLYPQQGTAAVLAAKLRRLAEGAAVLPWPDVAPAADTAALALAHCSDEALEEAFLAVFGHTVTVDCPPYETEYDQAHIFQKSQVLAEVVALYAAFGVGPNPGLKDRPDHLSVELAFMQFLTLKEALAVAREHGPEAVDVCRRGQENFLRDHLASWLGSFIDQLRRKAGPASPYAVVARLLEAFLEQEWAAFGIQLPQPLAVPAGRRRRGQLA